VAGGMMGFELREEAESLVSNIKVTADEAFHGPVGLFSNLIRFVFYAGLLGAAQLVIFQVINGAIGRAMEE